MMQAHPIGRAPRSGRGPSRARRAAVIVALGCGVLVGAQLLVLAPGSGSAPSAGPSDGALIGTRSSPTPPGGPTASDGSTPTPAPTPGASNSPSAVPAGSPFPGGVLIADRANARILVVNNAGRIVWTFPRTGSLPAGWTAVNADDAFMAPDGRSIVANDEAHQTIVRIDIATKRVIWSYGHYGRLGSARGYLHTPDDAYPLANGDVVVADIENCRILEIAPNKSIVREWGRTGVCRDGAHTFARPNGDTPLPDGGLLVTEITGSHVIRLAADGHVVFDIHVPVAYPSDAQLDPQGNVVVADFSTIGQVVAVDPRTGKVVWRWRYGSGPKRLDHPSLATPLADGTVSVNDDFRHRLLVIDPRTHRIVWQFGRTDVAGHGSSLLNDPDGHQPLPAGIVFG